MHADEVIMNSAINLRQRLRSANTFTPCTVEAGKRRSMKIGIIADAF
jgi:hypothetical protein